MIKEYLNSFKILSNKEIEAFLDLAVPSILEKGEFLSQEGQISNQIAYVKSGILRSFYYSSEGEEVTYCFTFKNALVTAYTSWITEKPSEENIQALTEMELLLISKEHVHYLELHYPNWRRFFKQIAEMEFVNIERRLFLLQRENAETRYQDLLINNPEYLHDIPLHYLASYLGVTQRHLSRIRKNISF
ncbi:Crp/Fnr family transcriptional regulator [Winogradskyella sp.]|uniref:Crp/Fnr family transcriptional regulator n=1 Tax=Winogradskyella sp. TaxID=1883156 RepID=UPI002604179F|nr:Crp/Fnr family transcriptional regulator [Winogradskyella sp.]